MEELLSISRTSDFLLKIPAVHHERCITIPEIFVKQISFHLHISVFFVGFEEDLRLPFYLSSLLLSVSTSKGRRKEIHEKRYAW